MQKIDKTADKILSTKYKSWLDKLIEENTIHDGRYCYYYDDIVMNLFKCQSGVCTYTEMYICPTELYANGNWTKGRYKIPDNAEYKRIDHLGELEHLDAEDKKLHYWNWDNLFMIHAKINSIKSDAVLVPYLKPDLEDYFPEKYFDYDDETHRFIPNTDIEDPIITKEIQNMIDKVLYLNHGVVRNERRDYINVIRDKRERGEPYVIDRFFTSIKWTL